MRFLIVPEPVALTDLFDNALTGADGKPATMDFKTFMLGRLQDAAFADGRKPGDAAIFVYETKRTIGEQSFYPGCEVALENDQWRAVLSATDEPADPYNPRLQHCLVPFIQAVRRASEYTQHRE